MTDFRLKVFVCVAKYLNFTRASKELFISQPAISKHIKELEQEFRTTLFNRTGTRIELTQAGATLLSRAEVILEDYRALESEMNSITGNFAGQLRIGASSTIAQYLLPAIIAGFMRLFPNIKISLDNGNSAYIEELLRNNKIDIGLVESHERSHDLHYTHLTKDELVLVTNAHGIYAKRDEITPFELTTLPLVLRETGSGTLNVIENTLSNINIHLSELNAVLKLDSTESIKSFIQNSDSAAIISIIAINKELMSDSLKIIDIQNLSFEREFAFVSRHGAIDSTIEYFMNYASRTVNKKKK